MGEIGRTKEKGGGGATEADCFSSNEIEQYPATLGRKAITGEER